MKIEYKWSMPNKLTFKIRPIDEFIQDHLPDGLILDPFANRFSDYGAITNDINPDANTDFNEDALSFLKRFDDGSISGILFDPPYSLRQVKECYQGLGVGLTQRESKRFYSDLKDEMARVLKQGGISISFGWSTVGLGKTRGFQKTRVLIVCHGGQHNDTLCLLETKIGNTL